MKKILLLLVFGFLITNIATSQVSVDISWLKGIGSKNSGNDNLNASCVDANGNLYIAGQVPDTTDFDAGPGTFTLQAVNHAFVAKYSPLGSLLWAKVLNGPGTSNALAIGVDGTGNVYVAGEFELDVINFDPSASNYTLAPLQTDMFFAKYDMNGSFQFAYPVGSSTGVVKPRAIDVLNNGDFFIGGSFTATDPNFNPASTSYTLANNGANDGFVAKYNASGIMQYAFSLGSTMADYVYGLDADPSGVLLVTGTFQGTVDFDPITTFTAASAGLEDIFLCKYSQSSSLIWAKAIGGSNGDAASRIKFDNGTGVILSGAFSSTDFDADPVATFTLSKIGAGTLDMFLGKYDSNTGNLIWAQNTGNSNQVIANDITIDQTNNVFVTGYFDNLTDFDLSSTSSFTLSPYTATFTDLFLAKYNTNGALLYANHLGGGNSPGNGGKGVFVDNANNIVLTGQAGSSIDLDFSANTNTIASLGGMDIFFSKYSQCISPDTPTLSATTITVCANGIVTLSIASGSLNSATNWAWCTTACGTSTFGSGTSVTVAPVIPTTYFVRGEGGCSAPGVCASVAVNITPLKEIYGQVSTASVNPVSSGLVILYRVEQGYTMWDSATYQNIQAGGNFTFTSVNSGTYILLAQPTSNTLQNTYAPNAIGWKNAQTFFHGCQSNTVKNVDVIPITNLGGGPGIIKGKIFEGVGYGNRSTTPMAPGNPIGGLTIKAGRNPGGDVVGQSRTDASGEYTLSGLSADVPGETYFVYVDVPGLDTNGTYHMAIVTGSLVHQGKDFVVDSMFIHPHTYVGVQEMMIDNNLVNVYPNPTNGVLNFNFGSITNQTAEIKITDMLGKVIESTQFSINHQSSQVFQLSLNTYNNGIYFVGVKINNFERKIKIIKAD